MRWVKFAPARCALPLAFALAASTAMADDAQRQLFIDTVAKEGCTIHMNRAKEIFPALGLSKEIFEEIGVGMLKSGEADFGDSRQILILKIGPCA